MNTKIFFWLMIGWLTPWSPLLAVEIKLGMTTSMDNAGITELIKSHYEEHHPEHKLKIIVAGTGKILSYLDTQDLDLAIVHNKDRELAFLADHPGHRLEVFSNAFILVGPKDDPAEVAQCPDLVVAMESILTKGESFISRGDDSGTHIAERSLWLGTGNDFSKHKNYLETGAGSGQSLNTAAAMNAYMFVDSPTFYLHNNKRNLVPLKEHNQPNIYSLIVPTSNLSSEKLDASMTFQRWLTSATAAKVFNQLDSSLIRYIATVN